MGIFSFIFKENKKDKPKFKYFSFERMFNCKKITDINYIGKIDRYFIFDSNEEFENFKNDLKFLCDNIFNYEHDLCTEVNPNSVLKQNESLQKVIDFINSKSTNINIIEYEKCDIYSQTFNIPIFEIKVKTNVGGLLPTEYLKMEPNINRINCCFFVKLGKNESSKHTLKEREEIIKHIKDKFLEEEQREKYEEEQREYEYFCERYGLNPKYPLSMHKFLKHTETYSNTISNNIF